MKLILTFLLVFGSVGTLLVNAYPRHHNRALHDDLEDFLALIPKDQLTKIFLDYLSQDAQVQYVVEYMQSSEFRELVKAVELIPDVVNFYNYLHESGLDIYYLVNKFHDFIGLPPLISSRKSIIKLTGGVSGLIADIKSTLPVDDIKALYHDKLETSTEFKKLVERLQSPKFQVVVNTLLANEKFKEILDAAKNAGIDVNAFADLLSTLFGLEFPDYKLIEKLQGLHDDLNDFLSLIPKDMIIGTFCDYLNHDDQVQYIIKYMQTSEFRDLVKSVDSIPNIVNFYNYLHESGLGVYNLFNKLHDCIELPLLPSSRESIIKLTGSVASLIVHINAILSVDDIDTLYHDKLETSAVLKKLVERLQSNEFQAVIDTLLVNIEFRELVKKSEAVGIDVNATVDLLHTVFGLEYTLNFHVENIIDRIIHGDLKSILEKYRSKNYETKYPIQHFQSVKYHGTKLQIRNLEDDMNDFIVLIPVKDIARIIVRYLANDAEVQEAARYIRSQELRDLAVKLQNDPEVNEFVMYFENAGAHIIPVVDILNELLNIPHYPKPNKFMKNQSSIGGVQAMLDEIRSEMPHDKIEALYEDKMTTSKDFQDLINCLKNPKFQKIVDKIVVNENVLELGYQAELHGINIETIAKFLTEIFGIHLPDPPYFSPDVRASKSRSDLTEDFKDFYNILPIEKILVLTADYIISDDEMRQVFEYMRSEDFKNLIRDLHEIPEYNQLLAKLQDVGVDMNPILDILHSLIGIGQLLRSRRPATEFQKKIEKPGLSGLIESINAILPYDNIKALYDEKLNISEAFADFIALISSQLFQTITDKLFENRHFVDLLHNAQAYGVNLELIVEFFLQVFGITTPPGIINYY